MSLVYIRTYHIFKWVFQLLITLVIHRHPNRVNLQTFPLAHPLIHHSFIVFLSIRLLIPPAPVVKAVTPEGQIDRFQQAIMILHIIVEYIFHLATMNKFISKEIPYLYLILPAFSSPKLLLWKYMSIIIMSRHITLPMCNVFYFCCYTRQIDVVSMLVELFIRGGQ